MFHTYGHLKVCQESISLVNVAVPAFLQHVPSGCVNGNLPFLGLTK